MFHVRLTQALEAGLLTPPLLVIGAPMDVAEVGLPDPTILIQTHQPDHDRLRARGLDVEIAPRGAAATALVCLPRERRLARDRIARAARVAPVVVVDGQKTDGIDAILKECRARADVGEVISKAHGKVFSMTGGTFDDWIAPPSRNADGYLTAPGTFSADGVDPASALLARTLPPLNGRVVDLGAGWGYLASKVLETEAVTECHLVEADLAALDCARENVDDPRARFHWADATAFRPEAAADHVVCNPPFHRGRTGDPDLGRAFLSSAATALAPRGTLWLVANRHLPYEAALRDLFSEIEEREGTPAFKLYRAARPRRARRKVAS
ncbi:16S rRNA (guanine1207-N2)-methyltransferase [Palleronia aestuarii]|uniref:16S rRNA (Guanine1207-N2)-methyltransferase n=1 Tax=Palleronia aestuarii TaxID=568105 RepID=A0A2W7NSP1_9RHOB|nr:methyltransferase [Palleronia aestuarii]PZX19634.1 16S rRNA (guanine1207-N2)-methyltransferase [Palleronia aestuarii]